MENRRKFVRFKPAVKEDIKVYLQPGLAPTSAFAARVDNLSFGGVGCVVDSSAKIRRNQVINLGVLLLSDVERIPFGGIVRWMTGDRLGIEFTMMSQRNRQQVMQFITKRELEEIRAY